MESHKMYSSTRWKSRTYLCEPVHYHVSCEVVQGRERKLGSTYRHGTVFAPKECLYQKEDTGMESPKSVFIQSVQKNSLTYAGLQTTPSQVSQYRAENENLRKFMSTFSHCTMFASKQCLFQKEATGMESPKMYSSSWCKKLTYLCGTANDPPRHM